MTEELLREDDLQQIRARGVGVDDVRQQLAILRNPPPYTRLLRACAAGDGIRVLDEAEVAAALSAHERAAAAGRFTCFVPASGAATRMFRALLAALEREPNLDAATLERYIELTVQEPTQHADAELPELTLEEINVFKGLRSGRWGERIRLEQERITWPDAMRELQIVLEQARRHATAAT